MHASDFDFVLPPELIAPYPAAERDGSALLVLERAARTSPAPPGDPGSSSPGAPGVSDLKISKFKALGEFLPTRSLLVVNETRVFPARLIGRKPTGGRVELLLLQRVGGGGEPGAAGGAIEVWDAMARGLGRPSGAVPEIVFSGKLLAQIVGRGEQGAVRARLVAPAGRSVSELIEEIGEVPLPPYILAARGEGGGFSATGSTMPSPAGIRDGLREIRRSRALSDGLRTASGAVAAPTAGLHFTTELLEGSARPVTTSCH